MLSRFSLCSKLTLGFISNWIDWHSLVIRMPLVLWTHHCNHPTVDNKTLTSQERDRQVSPAKIYIKCLSKKHCHHLYPPIIIVRLFYCPQWTAIYSCNYRCLWTFLSSTPQHGPWQIKSTKIDFFFYLNQLILNNLIKCSLFHLYWTCLHWIITCIEFKINPQLGS